MLSWGVPRQRLGSLKSPFSMRCECGTWQQEELEADGKGCAEPQTLRRIKADPCLPPRSVPRLLRERCD